MTPQEQQVKDLVKRVVETYMTGHSIPVESDVDENGVSRLNYTMDRCDYEPETRTLTVNARVVIPQEPQTITLFYKDGKVTSVEAPKR